MAKKVTAIFVLSVFALLLVVGMAWARKQAPIPLLNYAREDYVTNYLLKPAGEYSFLGTIHSPYTAIVGYTYYDYQHNASIPPIIANDYQAGGGGKHFTWMELEAADLTSNRFMDYNYVSPAGNWLGAARISETLCRGGYTALGVMNNSREVVCFHYASTCGSDPRARRTVLAIEQTTPGYNEFLGTFDISDSATGFGEGGMWPHMAIDSLNRIHVVMQSGETAAGKSWWGYTRVTELSVSQVRCESPGIASKTVNKGVFNDTRMVARVARTGTISEIVATSPVSKKVALIWQWPTSDTSYYQTGNDIYYLESTNGGEDWLNSGFPEWPDIGTNITQFKKTDNYKAYCDIAAVYDYSDKLHIIWNAHRLNTETGAYNFDDVALMHWSAGTTGQLCGTPPDTFRVRYNVIAAGEWEAVAGAWNRNMAKIGAGVGVSGGSNYNYIYCNWTQFNPNDVADNGYTNGEIYVSVSTNSGKTWDAPRNVTNSPDAGCLADDCDSDHWSSMAARVDSFLYLQWVNDRDAGGIPQQEGEFTLDPILYYRYPSWTPGVAARMDWTPKNYAIPWISVPNNGSTSKKVSISNIGTATLSVTSVTTSASWIGIGSYPASIAEGGCPGDLNITINCGLYSETFLADSIRVQSNDGAGNSDIYIKVNVVVSNTYKTPKFVAVGNGNFVLTESNLGNIGNQLFGMNLDTLATTNIVNPIFDGSIILGQMASAPRVGRDIFDEQYMLALDTFKVVTKAGVGSQIIKKRYAPMNPMPPEWSNWWCWGVEEYDVIFSSGATKSSAERWLLLQYVKVFQYPPPTWWKPGFGCPGTVPDLYVGEAIDIDLPSDSGSENFAGFDQPLNLLYQQGYGPGKDNYYAGLAFKNPNAATQPVAYGGHVTRNEEYVYPQSGYRDDSLYNVMTRQEWAVYDTYTVKRTDYNVVLTAGKIASHAPNLDTTRYNFVVAFSNDGLQKLKDLVKMTRCGNANRDVAGAINLGDVIVMAQYVLAGGAQPWLYMADVDGNCAVNLGDCIYLARYVLGPSLGDPKCNCEQKW
jgi:hypothetical protein